MISYLLVKERNRSQLWGGGDCMSMELKMFSRRSFLKGAFAAGGIIATSRLPLHARGDHERLSLAYSHIKAGATKPFSILHISDTHLTFADPDEE